MDLDELKEYFCDGKGEDSFIYGVRGIGEWAKENWVTLAIVGLSIVGSVAFLYYSDVNSGVKYPGAIDYIPGNCSCIESMLN